MQPLSKDFQEERQWWLFRTPNGVAGEPLSSAVCRNWFPVVYLIAGKVETFRIVTNDETITRKEAINFCWMVLRGEFTVRYVDLSKFGKVTKCQTVKK